MTRCPAPILHRTFADVLRGHVSRDTFLQLACFVEQVIAPRGTVVGVILTGDLGPTPGLELVIVLENGDFRGPSAIRWQVGPREGREIDLGMRWWSYPRLARQSWPEGVKHALSQGILLWDPEDLLWDFLETRLWYPDALRCHRLLDNCVRIDDLLAGHSLYHWLHRGDLLQAHHVLSTALDRLIDHLYDFNQVWRPSLAARFPALRRLEWVPAHLETRLEAAMRTTDLSRDTLLERKAALEGLYNAIQARVESEAWWPEHAHAQWRATLGGS